MPAEDLNLATTLETLPETEGDITVTLSNELIHLLSDQLYQSPSKAIEELVVNCFDADARECRVFIPAPGAEERFIVIYDDGSGMDLQGMTNLWHVGSSPKTGVRITAGKRKQIGKFGIGKLATYTLADKLTYVSRRAGTTLSVSLDFRDFSSDPTGKGAPVSLSVKRIPDASAFTDQPALRTICEAINLDPAALFGDPAQSWTFAVLESLKPKADKLRIGTLRHVLTTAMPYAADFKILLNGAKLESAKESFDRVVEFEVHDLPERRIEALKGTTGEDWKVDGKALSSASFPNGVSGRVVVTRQSLVGKSDDLFRSNGFFVRVRGRLINLQEPLFGIRPPSYQTFNRFRADINADDLDEVITAPREGIEESQKKQTIQALLNELYLEARQKYEESEAKKDAKDSRKDESERNYVNQRLVEHPVADVLATKGAEPGADADEHWFYLSVPDGADLDEVVEGLYRGTDAGGGRKQYKYLYSELGSSERMVKFDPVKSEFVINQSHGFVRANSDDGRARALLEDMVTAEALLEVYLREQRIPSHIVGEVLERRDLLLRSLVEDHPFAFGYIAQGLRDAASDERDLEAMLVAAMRALGFTAKQISNAGEPDGIARHTSYPDDEVVLTLEAKSSAAVPSLAAIDFAGLHEHVLTNQADGCLLLAPSYPGTNDDSAAANRAESLRISCWTVDQLASVVSAADRRHITAVDVIKIVQNAFKPSDVSEAVEALLSTPEWPRRDLYKAVIASLKSLHGRLRDKQRTVDMIASEVTRQPEFQSLRAEEVEAAVREVAGASQGGMMYKEGGALIITVSLEELERRLVGLTGQPGDPRRSGSFREPNGAL